MINITQGDDAVLNLTASDGNGNPIDLTGAVFTTLILGFQGVVISFPNGQHTANPDQTGSRGQFTLTLSETDTMNLGASNNKEIITLIIISGTQVYYRGLNQLNVYPPIPIQ